MVSNLRIENYCIMYKICAASSSFSSDDFSHSLFAIVESMAQHPTVLTDYCPLVVDKILPPLAALVTSTVREYHIALVGEDHYLKHEHRPSRSWKVNILDKVEHSRLARNFAFRLAYSFFKIDLPYCYN